MVITNEVVIMNRNWVMCGGGHVMVPDLNPAESNKNTEVFTNQLTVFIQVCVDVKQLIQIYLLLNIISAT